MNICKIPTKLQILEEPFLLDCINFLGNEVRVKIFDICVGRLALPKTLLYHLNNLSRVDKLTLHASDGSEIHLPEKIKERFALYLQSKRLYPKDDRYTDCHGFVGFIHDFNPQEKLQRKNLIPIKSIKELQIGDVFYMVAETIPVINEEGNPDGKYYDNSHSVIYLGDNLYLGVLGNTEIGLCVMQINDLMNLYGSGEGYFKLPFIEIKNHPKNEIKREL